VVFGDLLWRSLATVGGEDVVHTLVNDPGPDDANHAQDGMIDVPDDMRGHSLAGDLAG
jgi:hypothetical protein